MAEGPPRRRSLIATVVSGVTIGAIVATTAVLSGGFEAQKFDLGDGSVWVPNGAQQVIGRANIDLLALDTVVPTTSSNLSVVQSGATVLMLDETNARVGVVDAATAEIEESVPLPADSPTVYLAGRNAVIHSSVTGEVWITPVADLSRFDADSAPALTLGRVASMAPDGNLFVYSAEAGEVYRVDAAAGDEVSATAELDFPGTAASTTITSVGGRWAVFDSVSRTMSVAGREVDLSDLIGSGESAVLQQPSDAGDAVLIASSGGLISVPLDGGAPLQLVSGESGNPAAPVVVNGCSYAAWSSGQAWRRCGGDAAGVVLPLGQEDGVSADVEFVVNDGRVLLNDPGDGESWAVEQDGQPINNWDDLIASDPELDETQENNTDDAPELEASQVAPVAVDDEFGARPGRGTTLPVLLNDFDANGDVLIVDSVEPVDPLTGRLEIVDEGQSVQLTLTPEASGSLDFAYIVSDGRGGTATARVSVAIRTADENSAPAQVRRTTTAAALGAQATISVLGDWVDPDGDPVYLESATVAAPDTVNFRPEGVVVFQEQGGQGPARVVSLSVSDGSASGAGTLTVRVDAPGAVDIIADPFVVVAYAGQPVTISPLDHVRGGTGVLRLSSVPPKQGSTIEPNLDSGTFRFQTDEVRTHLLDYVVSDDGQSRTGTIRVEVSAAPTGELAPITVPKTMFVKSGRSESVDVASTDIDPAGGVLLVTELDAPELTSGIRAEVLDQAVVRVTLVGPLALGSLTIGYTVSNGLASTPGTITVVEIPSPPDLQPPIAVDDTVTVRVGDAIDIPVLANDLHPDGDDLELSPELVAVPATDSGVIFVSGTVIRFLAPDDPGNFTAVYEVRGIDGQVDQAQVNIAVREIVEATNAPPAPPVVIARVIAGETVRIGIPLADIDPDGDSVQLLGQATNPTLGSVTETGTDYIDYLAGDFAAGTDTFSYTVVDALGARALGVVRIGISPRESGPRNPVAVNDETSGRPGNTISVQVLANDSDPDGGQLTVVSVEPNQPDVQATIVGDVIDIAPPAAPGRYAVVYTIQNATGGTSSAFATVIVTDDAPRSYPEASDTVLTLSDILGRDTVDVDVLRNVFFADGESSSLDLSVLAGYDEVARVTANKHIVVAVTETRQIIPFAVAHPDDPDVVSYAFVWVPGFADALPQVDRTADPITVESGTAVVIPLEDHVVVAEGREPRLVDSTSVQATYSDGGSLVVDSQTLTYTSAQGYFGQASISFEVTDGEASDDSTSRTATLVLPITVTPSTDQPPVFTGASLAVEPGEQRTLDLARLTTVQPTVTPAQLVFTLDGAEPEGFQVTISGSSITVTADDDVAQGTSASLPIAVRDENQIGVPGTILLTVVPSSRPLAAPAADAISLRRGSSASIDVLANDLATNPFPAQPLRVVGIAGIGQAELPAGISVTPSADRSTLTISADATAPPVDTTFQYEVADATGDPGRNTFGVVTVSVADRPDAPVAPTRADGNYPEGTLTLRITPPGANNSPITGYTVLGTGGYSHDCGTELLCTLDDLVPGAGYAFSVVATNAVGASDSGIPSGVLSVDYVPAAPASVSAEAVATDPAAPSLSVTWAPVADPTRGSAVAGYTVSIEGPDVSYSTTVGANTTAIQTTAGGTLSPATAYVATVYAFNSAAVGSAADWNRATSAPVIVVGPPSAASGVTATVVDADGHIQVGWGASDPAGGSRLSYSVGRFDAAAELPASCSASGPQPGTDQGATGLAGPGWLDLATSDSASYRYVVYSVNEFYCTLAASGPVQSIVPPGEVQADVQYGAREGRRDVVVVSLAAAGANRFEARMGGEWFPVTDGQWLTSAESTPNLYAVPFDLELRGCRDASVTLCGPSTAPATFTPLNARATILTCMPGAEPTPGIPVNAGIVGASYQWRFNDGSGWTEYGDVREAPTPIEGSQTIVQVKATVTPLTGGDSFTDDGYAEGTCSP